MRCEYRKQNDDPILETEEIEGKDHEWSYDFNGWKKETVELNLETVEKTLSECHRREEHGYVRASSMLTLNGVILALLGTFATLGNLPTDTITVSFLTVGIFAFVISSCFLAYTLISPTRACSHPTSCSKDYQEHKQDYEMLLKHISQERIAVCISAIKIIHTNSLYTSAGIFSCLLGLWAIGSGMIGIFTESIAATSSIFLAVILGIVVSVIGVRGYHRAKL